MSTELRVVAGLSVGCVVAVAIGGAGFGVLQALWPEYAAAVPTKAYSLAMLISRLSIGALCAAGAACVTTLITRDARVGWWLGGLFVLLSLPSHLYYSWPDYPLWYHVVYLGYLVPIAGLMGRRVQSLASESRAALQ